MNSSFGASCYAFYYGLRFALLKMLLLYLFQNRFQKGIHVIGKGSYKKREIGKFLITLTEKLKRKLSNFKFSNLKLSNLSFFPTALSSSMYPFKRTRWKSRRLRVNLRQTVRISKPIFPLVVIENKKITVSFSSSNTFSKNYL